MKIMNLLLEKMSSKGNHGAGLKTKEKLKEARKLCSICEKRGNCVNWCKPVIKIFEGDDGNGCK